MNEHARHLWMLQTELVFEVGDDGVDAAHRQIVGQRAVTVHLNGVRGAAVSACDGDLVNVDDLRKVRRGSRVVALRDFWQFRSGAAFAIVAGSPSICVSRVAMTRHLAANVGLKLSGDLVRAAQRHRLRHLEVLFQMQCAVVLLQRDVMNGQIAPGSHSAHAIKGALVDGCRGHCLHHDIRAFEPPLHSLRCLRGHLFGALKAQRARKSDREIDKVIRA